MPKNKHSLLLDEDPKAKRWFNNLARGCVVTAHESSEDKGRI